MLASEGRRITGRHPCLEKGGAGIELSFEPNEAALDLARQVGARAEARARAEGWSEPVVIKRYRGGAGVYLPAPADRRSAAACLLEWAAGSLDDEGLRAALHAEPGDRALLACLRAAGDRPAFVDDEGFTLGLGAHARTWPLAELPPRDALREGGEGIPFAYITGTNGKTTTTRLLARMAREAGRVPGYTSSEGIVVGTEVLEAGDWTGPGAARRVLRDPRVDLAVLETARGGLMRRGLVLDGAPVAVVTNVADDHLGEWGLHSLMDMARAKLTVGEALRPNGVLVVNGNSAVLREAVGELRFRRPDLRVWWFADRPAQLAADLVGHADDTTLRTSAGGIWLAIALSEVPLSYGGAARFNVENALAAALAAIALGLPSTAIMAGLAGMHPSTEQSHGRSNAFRLPSGSTAIVDFAHNPHGLRQIAALARALGPQGVSIMLGQAGDRTEADLRGFAEAAAALFPWRVYLKELPEHNRGRAEGEVRALLRRFLESSGLQREAVVDLPDEVECARHAIAEAGPGQVVLLLAHERVDEVLSAVRAAGGLPWS